MKNYSTHIRQQITEDILLEELGHLTDEELAKLGYDPAKLHSEGSTWIVTIWDYCSDYYSHNRTRIDKIINEILEKAKTTI